MNVQAARAALAAGEARQARRVKSTLRAVELAAERLLDPETRAYAATFARAEDEAKLDRAARRRGGGRKSGYGGGRVQPRCSSCDHFIATVTSRCTRCGNWGGET